MCGIFGVITKEKTNFKQKKLIKSLFILSESRGKEASGIALIDDKKINVCKTPNRARYFIKSKSFNKCFAKINKNFIGCIGHSRLVTDGYEHENKNNQPVIKNKLAVIHNGIIVNTKDLWRDYSKEIKQSQLDTEIIPVIISSELNNNKNLSETIKILFNKIYGMTSVAILFNNLNNLLLATNNGSLYYLLDESNNIFAFASEFYILKKFIKKNKLNNYFSEKNITQLKAGEYLLLDLKKIKHEKTNIKACQNFTNIKTLSVPRKIKDIAVISKKKDKYINTSFEYNAQNISNQFYKTYQQRKKEISKIKYCKQCILPETFPYIYFDKNGVCNYCNKYFKINYQGKQNLKNILKKYQKPNSRHDCLVPFSGGRDSSYMLHFLKKELKMNPLAYSYDWGMITDLGRRNQSRICGKLGIEHILISADIRKKRENIKKNILAWIKRPNLGTIPLFMAGDKKYFYYANLLMKQNNLKISILGENLLETTNFKSGLCKIKPNFDKKNTYALTSKNKLKMLYFYGKEYILNPAYLNSSLFDTIDAFKSYYLIKHQNINIYNFIKWEERKINKTLIEEYDWETDPHTKNTWRIGDGTVAFYNYIYYIVAGFTENNTFRSNQIREGVITREKALMLAEDENRPRYESIKWYCNTIKIDFEKTLKIINSIPKLYNK
ncbi:hypothetical protein ISS06_01995 [Patescibacteria group bacterium]|nr:hypothetical protein [Patescibacteria group bacterium]